MGLWSGNWTNLRRLCQRNCWQVHLDPQVSRRSHDHEIIIKSVFVICFIFFQKRKKKRKKNRGFDLVWFGWVLCVVVSAGTRGFGEFHNWRNIGPDNSRPIWIIMGLFSQVTWRSRNTWLNCRIQSSSSTHAILLSNLVGCSQRTSKSWRSDDLIFASQSLFSAWAPLTDVHFLISYFGDTPTLSVSLFRVFVHDTSPPL